MSRSGYSDDCEYLELYRASVDRAIHGKRGQAFLKDLAAALDAMPVKSLIRGDLVNDSGECCAIGSVCLARGVDTKKTDSYEPESVARLMGIARCLAAEIANENDNDFRYGSEKENGEERWIRMRKWVTENIPIK